MPGGGFMSQINPFTGAIAQSLAGQRLVATEKEQQLRREQKLEKNVAAREDAFEHQVESSQSVQPVQDEDPQRQQQSPDHQPPNPKKQPDDAPRLDLKA